MPDVGYTPPTGEEIIKNIQAWKKHFDTTIFGVPIVTHEFVPRDKIYFAHDPIPGGESVVAASPLMAIEIKHLKRGRLADYDAWLKEAMNHVVSNAHRRLDALARVL